MPRNRISLTPHERAAAAQRREEIRQQLECLTRSIPPASPVLDDVERLLATLDREPMYHLEAMIWRLEAAARRAAAPVLSREDALRLVDQLYGPRS